MTVIVSTLPVTELEQPPATVAESRTVYTVVPGVAVLGVYEVPVVT